ncbi:hypothetical protein K438DRAFT_2002725 [Mycena galopus ATCC 62051]|nr:hypothetical protein K438DRAFT_2002725 [Mycena galopus ATCC 62051]
MKNILSVIPLSLTACLISASKIGEPPVLGVAGRSAETCGDPADAVPFYRIFDASIPARFYTPDVATVTTSIKTGYALETVAAMVFATQEESTVPFYRLVDPAISVNFWTINTTEVNTVVQEGYSVNTLAQVYIYPTEICGSVPFYRLSNSANKDSVYTTSDSERLDFITEGFTDLGIAGYVFPVEVTQC